MHRALIDTLSIGRELLLWHFGARGIPPVVVHWSLLRLTIVVVMPITSHDRVNRRKILLLPEELESSHVTRESENVKEQEHLQARVSAREKIGMKKRREKCKARGNTKSEGILSNGVGQSFHAPVWRRGAVSFLLIS